MKQNLRRIITTIIGSTIVAGLSTNTRAQYVTVTDITDWSTTPNEVVSLDLPDIPYSGGVYAGINTLSVNGTTYSGFCIDPFHYSVSGPQDKYKEVSLAGAPKTPGPMSPAAARDIQELWAKYFTTAETSPTVAAGLQLAIWDVVVDSVASSTGKPVSYYISLNGSQTDYGAAADIASLATYTGPLASLTALTGPGQDYVIDSPPPTPNTVPPLPDGGATAAFLGVALVGIHGVRRKFGCMPASNR